jgi:hypothetical protein
MLDLSVGGSYVCAVAKRGGSVHVATTRRHYKGKTYESVLLRRSYRENDKVKSETVGNLSHLPAETIELIRASLAGQSFMPAGQAGLGPDGFSITRSLPHGHVAAAAAMANELGLAKLIGPACRARDLVLGLVLARVTEPGSKLAATRCWADTTIGADLRVDDARTDEVYAAMDWLLTRKNAIEAALAGRHLSPGSRVLFDLSSSWLEGWACPLAARGHSRDGKRGKPQLEYGILADGEGRPLAVEVFKGNTADPTAFIDAVASVRKRFGLSEATFVGDRGMITTARIDALRELPGASWITALRAPQIKKLLADSAIQPSLFDQTDLAESTHPDYPGERLIACRNPFLAAERARKRDALLSATEADLAKIEASVAAGRMRSPAKIGQKVGTVLGKHKMGKHFHLDIAERHLAYTRKTEAIEAEAAADGIYVIRTPLPAADMPAPAVVGTYKSLAEVEADFRSWKAIDLQLRPIFHFTEDRVRAHVLLCLLAGYLTWHLRRALAPIPFTAPDRIAQPDRPDPVGPARPSTSARTKAARKRTDQDEPVHSFRSLLSHLATLTRNTCRIAGTEAHFDKVADPTPIQRRAFELIGANIPLRLT